MGLFDKKQCVICGKQFGLLGGSSIADGHLCNDCKRKFSPYASRIGKMTAEEVRRHLEYREKNQVDHTGRKGRNNITEKACPKNGIDNQRILERAKVRLMILFGFVDCLNWHFNNRITINTLQQHPRFKLEALSRNVQKFLHKGGRDSTQTGLCILKL